MRWLLALILVLPGCATTFVEFKGECVIQQWDFASLTIRRRQICDFPPPDVETEGHLRDREAMDTNPFPDLFERNDADSTDPNLLEKSMGYPQE